MEYFVYKCNIMMIWESLWYLVWVKNISLINYESLIFINKKKYVLIRCQNLIGGEYTKLVHNNIRRDAGNIPSDM